MKLQLPHFRPPACYVLGLLEREDRRVSPVQEGADYGFKAHAVASRAAQFPYDQNSLGHQSRVSGLDTLRRRQELWYFSDSVGVTAITASPRSLEHKRGLC